MPASSDASAEPVAVPHAGGDVNAAHTRPSSRRSRKRNWSPGWWAPLHNVALQHPPQLNQEETC